MMHMPCNSKSCSIQKSAIVKTATEASSAAEPCTTPYALLELLHNDNIWCVDALHNQLSDTITLFNCEVDLAEIEEDDFHRTTIIGINDACASVDAVFDS
jgi:hypothetical protein